MSLVSGLSLGLHTVKVAFSGGSVNLYGFEILNTASTTALNVNPGSGYVGGQKYSAALAQAPAYNPYGNTWYTFTIPSSSILAGTQYTNNGATFTVLYSTSSSTTLVCAGTGAPTNASGGTLTAVLSSNANLSYSNNPTSSPAPVNSTGYRIAQYLNASGTVGQAFTPCALSYSSTLLSNANHTNEEVVRSYYPREFGAGRADDFSLMTATPRSAAFTLDDGTATLVVSGGRIYAPSTGLKDLPSSQTLIL